MGTGSEWLESYFAAYSLTTIDACYGSLQLSVPEEPDTTLLLAVAGGQGEAVVEGRSYSLQKGKLLLLPEGSGASIKSSSNSLLQCYAVGVAPVIQTNKAAGSLQRQSKITSLNKEAYIDAGVKIVELAQQLYIHRLPVEELRHIKNQLIFHEMLYELLQCLEHSEKGETELWSLEQSVRYMEQQFREKISREQLAAATGISSSHYSVAFKQLTGYSPNHYMTTLRVHHAMELLLQGKETLREVAIKTGYKDEFYLSRRFKQHTGISPSNYVAQFSKRVAVLIPPYASHLMLLGVEPTVSIADSSEYISSSELSVPQTMRLMSEDCSAEQLKRALLESKTELIIASDPSSAHLEFNAERLRIIAPVVTVSWMDMGWKEHFRYIANIVQERERAERWLAEFEREEAAARQLISQTDAMHAVVSIVVIKPQQLLVYGARNAGYVIYHSLGLAPPERIRQQLERHGHKFHSLPIALSELPLFASDKMLVIVFPDEEGSTTHADSIVQSDIWQSLPAVQNGQAFMLDQNDWIPYNPVSIQYQLRRAVKLFENNCTM